MAHPQGANVYAQQQPGFVAPQQQYPQQAYHPGHPGEKGPQAHQPQPQQGMTVQGGGGGGGNRNAKNLPMDGEGREWSNGLCDCCDDAGTCLLAWFCPCIVYAQVKQRLEHLTNHGTPDPEHGGSTGTGSDCMMHGLMQGCCGLGWIFQIGTRGAIRQRYRIKGGGFGDCCTAYCCTPCELTQESRELQLEEESFAGYKH